MNEAVENHDRITLIILNQEFHTSIYRSNPNQLSMPMIENIWLQLGPFMRIALRYIGTFYGVDRLDNNALGEILEPANTANLET